MPIPKIGVPFVRGAETLIPTYVALSEAPRADGACVTADTADRDIEPAGYYVEYRYVGSNVQYRDFIPYTETEDGSA